MMLNWHVLISGLGAAGALVAAGFWLWASVLPVPENQDTFIAALQHIGRINASGAMAACVAALCGAALFVREMIS